MEERRKFLRGVGLFGALAAGAMAARGNTTPPVIINNNYTTVTGDEFPTEELEKQIAGKPMLQLRATYGEELPPEQIYATENKYVIGGIGTPQYKPGTEKQVRVDIVPGPDGKLYVKENDTWRKL